MVVEDKVQLPRLYLSWPSAPMNTRADALLDVLTDILTSGKNSRLFKSLVFDKQIAQSVRAYQDGSEIAGTLAIEVTAKPGKNLAEMESAVDTEITRLLNEGVTEKEIQTSVNRKEAQLVNGMTTVFGIANALATYYCLTGDANNINKEFDRFKGITPGELLAEAKDVFSSHKVVLSVVPEGKPDLSAEQNRKQPKGNSK
jgi:zinc protease